MYNFPNIECERTGSLRTLVRGRDKQDFSYNLYNKALPDLLFLPFIITYNSGEVNCYLLFFWVGDLTVNFGDAGDDVGLLLGENSLWTALDLPIGRPLCSKAGLWSRPV